MLGGLAGDAEAGADLGPGVALGAQALNGLGYSGVDLITEAGHMDESFDVAAPYTVGVAAQDAPGECGVLVVFDPPPWAFWFEPVTLACKLPARCRLPSLTWGSASPPVDPSRPLSDLVVVRCSGQART